MFVVHSKIKCPPAKAPEEEEEKKTKLNPQQQKSQTAKKAVPGKLDEIQKTEARIQTAEQYLVHAQNDLLEAKQHQKKTNQLLSNKIIINFDTIVQWMPSEKLDALSMVLHSTPFKQVDKDPKIASILQQRTYTKELPGNASPCNQMYSGRCWMFAGLNILRRMLINQYKLKPTFELSQSYLFFWHYFEQYNDMLNLFYHEKNLKPVEKAEYLDKPLHDGGNWITFRRLARKYGVVPKNMYRETWPSSHSSEMNGILCHLLQNDIRHCSTLTNVNAFDDFRNKRLKQVLHILCSCMGRPPMCNEFFTTLETIEKKSLQLKGTALSTFNALNVNFDIDQHIQIVNDPRPESLDLTWYSTQHQSLHDTPELFFNVKNMEKICAAVALSIQFGRGVWFACNMNEDVCPQLQGMAKGLFRPDKFIPKDNQLEMSKPERMIWGRAHCNHAMLIVGVECDRDGKALAFKIENSWGATGPGHGFYKMTADWFCEHTYTVVIHRDIVTKADIAVTEHPKTMPEYLYFDIFG